MAEFGDRIVEACLRYYTDAVPRRGKPQGKGQAPGGFVVVRLKVFCKPNSESNVTKVIKNNTKRLLNVFARFS